MLSAQAEYALSSQSDKTSQLSADSTLKTVDIRVRFFKHLFIACVLLLCKSPSVGAYVCKPFSTGYLQTPRKQRSSLQMYVPSSTPTSQTQAMVAKKMLGDNRNKHTQKNSSTSSVRKGIKIFFASFFSYDKYIFCYVPRNSYCKFRCPPLIPCCTRTFASSYVYETSRSI